MGSDHLREAHPEVQFHVINLGKFKDCRNPSSALMSRIKQVKVLMTRREVIPVRREEDFLFEEEDEEEEAVGEKMTKGKWKTEKEKERSRRIEQFLIDNGIDGSASDHLREAHPEVQF